MVWTIQNFGEFSNNFEQFKQTIFFILVNLVIRLMCRHPHRFVLTLIPGNDIFTTHMVDMSFYSTEMTNFQICTLGWD
jgi:hypothetical protein